MATVLVTGGAGFIGSALIRRLLDDRIHDVVTVDKPTYLYREYRRRGALRPEMFVHGMAWLDTGTHASPNESSGFVQAIERRQGLKIGCPEAVALRLGHIDDVQQEAPAGPLANSAYGWYLPTIMRRERARAGH